MLATIKTQVKQIACNYRNILSQYTLKEVITLWGILNEMIWCAAINAKAISKRRNENLVFYQENIPKLINESITVVTPVQFLVKYLKKFWSGLTYGSATAIRRLRSVLCEEFKLFTLEERDWSDPSNRHRAPNPCGSFDIIGGLVLARLCEDAALTHYELEDTGLDWSQPIGNGNYPQVRNEDNSLPAHKAYTLVALYNLVFEGIDRWGREEADFTDQEPRPEVVQSLKVRTQTLQAEQAFEEALQANPSDPEIVLITQTFDYVETEEVSFSDGSRILEPKVISTHLLCEFVRLTMKIPPTIRPLCQKREESVNVPAWALDRGVRALAWWQKRLGESGLWFTEIAPLWVLDEIVPF